MEESQKFEKDVFICDGNQKPLGSGVLFIPENPEYAFVLTAAHLFRNKDCPSEDFIILNIYSSFLREMHISNGRGGNPGRIGSIECDILKAGEMLQDDSDSVIMIHSDYDPEDERSPYDLAVIRLKREDWMNEMKTFSFPKEMEERTELVGYGYPRGGAGEQRQKRGDFFSGRRIFECESYQIDCVLNNITVSHQYKNQEGVNLEGFSGTGIFDAQGKFYGVVARTWGADDAPGTCVVSSSLAFVEILKIFGCTPPTDEVTEENEIFVDLNVRGHWLLNRQGNNPKGFMDDREVVNLASLLFGMTDAYVVILASTWKNGIASALERMLDEFAVRNHKDRKGLPFPKWKESSSLDSTIEDGEGLVLNVMASRPDLSVRIRETFQKYGKRNAPLIINIWSQRPAEAWNALNTVFESPQLQAMGDYISVIDDSEKIESTAPWSEGRQNPQPEKQKSAEENLKDYQVARASGNIEQRWLRTQSEESIEELFTGETLYNLLDQDEIDDLTVQLWIYIKEFPEREFLKSCYSKLKRNCSENRYQLIHVLEGHCDLRDMVGMLRPEEIQIWSDLATDADYKKNVEEIKDPIFYWIAIMRGINGYEYVMRERICCENSRFISRLLNRRPEKEKDELMETQASYIREYIRPGRK